MHLLLVLLNKPNLLISACVNYNSFASYFTRFFERCDVIVTLYFMKVKCFSFCTLLELASYSDSILLHALDLQRRCQKLFFIKKMVMAHKTHVISRKSSMMKSKDRKSYMYLKFRINPPLDFVE